MTVPVFVEFAEKIQADQEYTYSVGDDDSTYYEITPSESGWYYLDSGKNTQHTTVYDSSNKGISVEYGAWYMTAGNTYCVEICGDDIEGKPGTFTVQRITQEIPVQAPTSIAALSVQHNIYFATFTAEEDGVYVFTSDNTTNQFDLRNETEKVYVTNPLGELNFSTYISAGTTFLISAKVESVSEGGYTINVQKKDTIVRTGVEYEFNYQYGDEHYYIFTPETSGYYLFGMMNGSQYEPPVVLDGNQRVSGEIKQGTHFSANLVELEEGKQYGIKVVHYQYDNQDRYWFIRKLESLTPGKNIEVQVDERYAFCAFTPVESGVYTFTSEKFSEAFSYINTYVAKDGGMYTIISSTDSQLNNSISAVLEEGKTYIFYTSLYSANCTSFQMDLVKEQALIVGDNTVSIADRNSISDGETNAICSFTPKADGLYEFSSHGAGNADPIITVYDSERVFIGDDDSSGEEENFKLELILEAGKTYYINISDYNEYDLPVEVRKLELMENKLEGYSLSLDGSIAVNLYMTLNERLAKSDTAVLQYTRADKTVVSYDMKAADEDVLNGKTYYVFHLPVAAKEMASELKVQIIDTGSSFEGKEYTFTIQDYARQIIDIATNPEYFGIEDNHEYVQAKPLAVALLNYGAAAQKYFNWNIDRLANEYVSENSKYLGNVPTSLMPKYDSESTKLPDGVTFGGASLSLESETTLTFYFSNPSGVKLSFFDGKGARISSGTSGEYTTVRVKNIPAHKLSDYVSLSIKAEGDSGEYSITYNPMTYCYNVLTRPLSATRTQDLKDLMKAFYFYNQAAVRCMASKGEA